MKPVEIEFLMKDNLTGGLDKAGLAVDILAEKSEKAAAAINARILEQRKVIDRVNSDLHRMETQLQNMKPGPAQAELAADVAACRKVLDEERAALEGLEKEHREAEKSVRNLRKEYERISLEEERAAAGSKSLTDKIREQKEVIGQIESDIKSLEKAYQGAAPGKAKVAALDELNAAKKALEEEKGALAELQAEQEKTRASSKRLSMQLRELQDNMARLRLEGKQDTEEYRKMARQAALLSDTLADLNTQTKILSHDDANLQGFMSGVSGLAGLFTTATGALSLFASENENLAKIQTRVQSVMAITMGLQQVFNTLNKDSAFRLVTVVKMKNLLTAANTRLAVALGISTGAAQALMATLTLGLSAVITGIIVLWDKYSDAQEKAAEKAKERVKIESDGRAQMIKTRFEIESTLASLKKFTGTKDEEKAKVEELNRKYGESFGYYDTIAQWYDILQKKGEKYIRMLFLQAKVQSLVNKATEADEKVNEIKASRPEDVDGSMGWFARMGLYMAQSDSYGRVDAQSMISEYNEKAKEKAVREAEEVRDGYLAEARKLQEEYLDIGKEFDLGDHAKPDPNAAKKEKQSEEQRASELLKLQMKNRQSMLDYLKEYGTYQQKKLAIAQEYAEKIRKAQEAGNLGEVLRLGRRQKEETAAAEIASLKADIDWDGLFGNFGGLLEEQLRPTLAKLRKYAASDEYRNAGAEDKQVISQLIAKLEDRSAGGINRNMFKDVSRDLSAYQTTLRELTEAKEREKAAADALVVAQEKQKKAAESGDPAAMKEAEELVATAQEAFDAASASVATLTEANDKAAQDLRTSSTNAVSSLTGLAEGLQSLKSGSLAGMAQGLGKLGEATKNMGGVMGSVGGTLAETFSNGGIIGQIIAAVLSILDVLKEGIGTLVSGILDSVLGAVNGILENILSGELFTQIGSSLFYGVRDILDTVTFGLFSSHGNAREVNALVERLTESNKYLTTAIEKLTDEMASSGGARSTEYYRSAYDKQKQKIENDRQMLAAKMGYHSSHHSNNYYIGKAMGSGDWDTVSAYLGKSVRDTDSLWSLSPEELARLQELPDIWEKLHSGKYDQSQWLDEYVSDANTLLELQRQWQEAITDTSFDGIRSGMKDLLKDFETDSKDVIASVDEFMENAILKSIVNGTYSDELKKWQETFAEFMSDGILSKEEADTLRDRYSDIFERARAKKEEMFDTAGITEEGKSTTQTGRAGGFSAMSQDQGTKLEGMFTSGLNHWVSIDEKTEDVAGRMASAEGHLAKIAENTGKSAGFLGEIKEDIKRIIRDGLRMKSS